MTASAGENSNTNKPEAPGADAINAALARLYPGQQPRHWGPKLPFTLGGPDPLDGISVYLHDDPQANSQANPQTGSHWHYVSFGMTELYAKQLPNRETSGWGFEFTFRLRRSPIETQPPQWPLSLMQNLARYVFQTSNILGPGHYMHLNGPIASDQETALHAAMFIADPQLPVLDTPNGRLRFLLIVGATIDELAAARAWNAEKLLATMQRTNPLLVTDLARRSILDDPGAAQYIADETATDGSSSGGLSIPALTVELSSANHLTITVGASTVGDIQALLRGRTAHGRDFQLSGPDQKITFLPADRFSTRSKPEEKNTEITLSFDMARALATALHPQRGDYQIPGLPSLTFRITPSEIKDHTGEKIVRVIG